MIPYLLLPSSKRLRIEEILQKGSKSNDVFEGLRSTLEELGNDESVLERIFSKLSENGEINPSLWDDVKKLSEGTPEKDVDWRAVPRRRRRKL